MIKLINHDNKTVRINQSRIKEENNKTAWNKMNGTRFMTQSLTIKTNAYFKELRLQK